MSQELPYPADDGQTHFDECWRERRHHNCAIRLIDSLRAQLEKVEAERDVLLARENEWMRNSVLGIAAIAKMNDAYQRGAREMRERAAKECDLMASCWDREHRTQREKAQSYDHAAFRIRALPDTLPTGPSESAKV